MRDFASVDIETCGAVECPNLEQAFGGKFLVPEVFLSGGC